MSRHCHIGVAFYSLPNFPIQWTLLLSESQDFSGHVLCGVVSETVNGFGLSWTSSTSLTTLNPMAFFWASFTSPGPPSRSLARRLWPLWITASITRSEARITSCSYSCSFAREVLSTSTSPIRGRRVSHTLFERPSPASSVRPPSQEKVILSSPS
ncbi:hypothetical protein BGW80DRAFT_1299094, partial [Lactifluus volemus]